MPQPPSIIQLTSGPNAPPPVIPSGGVPVSFAADGAFPVNHVAAYLPAGVNPYHVWWAFSGPNYPSLQTYLLGAFPLPVTFPANFAGSTGSNLSTGNATASKTFNILKISSGVTTTVGTITCNTSGGWAFASTGGLAISFAANDMIAIQTPSTDSTLADFAFVLAGLR